MNEIKVSFETITPLWTGDAWGENSTIRPSSIMGSLRFWFEILCYFAKVTNNKDYDRDGKLKGDVNSKVFQEKLSELVEKNSDRYIEEFEDMTLSELGVPLPARIFGCTGWQGRIGIKKITDVSKNNNYGYYQGKLEMKELEYTKRSRNGQTKKVIPAWYFDKGFMGVFKVIFKVENDAMKNGILYPLLNFIQQYGFLGGRWNIGYGRVKVSKIEINAQEINNLGDYKEFKIEQFNKYKKGNNKIVLDGFYSNKKFDDVINYKTGFKELEEKDRNILVLKEQIRDKNLKETIKELIRLKAEHRKDISNYSERHSIFGIAGRNAEGTKILPWIYEENGQLKGGFISIAGLLNLK